MWGWPGRTPGKDTGAALMLPPCRSPEGFHQRCGHLWRGAGAEAGGPPQPAAGGEHRQETRAGWGRPGWAPPSPCAQLSSLLPPLQAVFPRTPAATTPPAESLPAKVSAQRGGAGAPSHSARFTSSRLGFPTPPTLCRQTTMGMVTVALSFEYDQIPSEHRVHTATGSFSCLA